MAPLAYAIDSYLVSLFTDYLGTGNPALDADPLQLKTVIAFIIRDVRDWEGWVLPGLVVLCRDEDRAPGPHGDGIIHWDKNYPVHIIGIVEDSQASVLGRVKLLQGRIEDLIRDDVALGGLSGDGGEVVYDYRLESTSYQVYPRSNDPNIWFGVCASLINVESTK